MAVKCAQCNGDVPEPGGILLTIDADFACSPACKKAWEDERDRFFGVIVHSSKRTEKWLMGED